MTVGGRYRLISRPDHERGQNDDEDLTTEGNAPLV